MGILPIEFLARRIARQRSCVMTIALFFLAWIVMGVALRGMTDVLHALQSTLPGRPYH